MPRESKDQKRARLAALDALCQTTERALYSARMMAALEEATEHGWTISIAGRKFRVWPSNPLVYDGVVLSSSWDEESQQALERLEHQIIAEKTDRAEAAHKEELRRSGRAKLTDEEARALGLL